MSKLSELREEITGCRRCELYREATQAVTSVGNTRARMMLVGEQPGDHEDVEGEPFVGPAGRVLDAALQATGIERSDVYLTNAVKHFRFERRGKRRIHRKPAVEHIEACHPWLEAEVAIVRPRVVLCLGATAGRAVLGRPVRIGEERGGLIEDVDEAGGAVVVITTHPSSLLRLRDRGDYDAELERLVADLRLAASAL